MKISIDVDDEEFLHYEYSSVDESSNDSPLTSSTDEFYSLSIFKYIIIFNITIYIYRRRHQFYECLAACVVSTSVSVRNAAKIVSCIFKDIGSATDTDKSQVVDRNNIRRKQIKKPNKVQSVFFDGKIDKTRLDSGKFIKEEYATTIAETGHKCISRVIKSNADGSAANTGYATGVIWRLGRFAYNEIQIYF